MTDIIEDLTHKHLPMNTSIIQKAWGHALQHRTYMEIFSFLVVANIIAAAAGWLTQVKIANSIGKELFGQVAYGIMLGSFGQVFIRVGLDRTLVRDLIHYPDRITELVHGSLYLRYGLLIITFIGLITWKLLSANTDLSWGVILIVSGWSMLSLDLQPLYDTLNEIKRHTNYFLFQKSLYLLLIWSILLFLPGLISVLYIGIILVISVSLYLFLQHRWAMKRLPKVKSSIHTRIDTIIWLLQNNWLVWITSIAGIIIGLLNQFMLRKYFGFAELGGYAAVWQFVTIGTLLIDQISRIGRPEMAKFTRNETPKPEQIRFIIKYILVMVLAILPIALFMFCFPHFLITTLFKPEYLTFESENTLAILGIYLLTSAVGYVLSQYIISIRLEKKYFFSVVIGGILSIVLCTLLIPAYGSIGAAWALTLSYGATVISFGIITVLSLIRWKTV